MKPVGRRDFLAGMAAIGASVATKSAAEPPGPEAQPLRYPERNVVSLDKRFDRYRIGNTPLMRLHTGMLWAEGPAWNGVGRYLVWSDIPNDAQLRWLAEDGHVSVLRSPSNNSNGNTFDWEGRQISFEHATRRVVRYERDGSVSVLAEKFRGKPLNAPNDGAVHPDGSLWFTDPGYGSLGNYEGRKGDLQLKEAVYRLDRSGRLDVVADDVFKPNGLCFSPDYERLYVADTGASHYPDAPKHIKVWDVDGARLKNGREFASMKLDAPGGEKTGLADGIRADVDGNVWAAVGWAGDGYDGVHVFAQDGQRIGMILLPEICANLCFGGPKRNRLFMTASRSLYALYVETQGAHVA